jgi:hypothetical protein
MLHIYIYIYRYVYIVTCPGIRDKKINGLLLRWSWFIGRLVCWLLRERVFASRCVAMDARLDSDSWQNSPFSGIVFLRKFYQIPSGFLLLWITATVIFIQSKIVGLASNIQRWRPRLYIFVPHWQGGPVITPDTQFILPHVWVTIDGVLDGRSDLLSISTHDSRLHLIIAPLYVFTSRSLITAYKSGDSSVSALTSLMSSEYPTSLTTRCFSD